MQAEKSNLIIYRFREQGLEVFLVNKDGEDWQLPQGISADAKAIAILEDERVIELNPVEDSGILEQAYAVEGDWHDIPSLKDILKHDVLYVKDTFKQMIPDMMEKGAFFAVKEAFRKVLPHQYDLLKELKDVLTDRNSTKYM